MAHRSMVGNRLRLSLDETLAAEVMWEIRRVSLASRGACLPFRRYPLVGDMLTTVDGLKENIRRQNQLLTGLTAMHIATTDQRERPVLDRTMFA